jgi:hypothetical protein
MVTFVHEFGMIPDSLWTIETLAILQVGRGKIVSVDRPGEK